MLGRKRVDLLIEYPIEGHYAAKENNAETDLKTVLIEEDSQPVYSYTSCARTTWGKETIQAINRALLKIRPTDTYREVYEKRIDSTLIPEYRQYYNEYFLQAK